MSEQLKVATHMNTSISQARIPGHRRELAGDVLAAERKAVYARISAATAERLLRDQAVDRHEFDRRQAALREAEDELRRVSS